METFCKHIDQEIVNVYCDAVQVEAERCLAQFLKIKATFCKEPREELDLGCQLVYCLTLLEQFVLAGDVEARLFLISIHSLAWHIIFILSLTRELQLGQILEDRVLSLAVYTIVVLDPGLGVARQVVVCRALSHEILPHLD